MIETYNFAELSHNEQFIIAGIVSAYSHPSTQKVLHDSQPTLVPVEHAEIMASEHALVSFVQDSIAGYVRAKPNSSAAHNNQEFREVGSLIVLKPFRRMGIGSALVTSITEAVVTEGQIPYAFCGPDSQALFERVGYQTASQQDLPITAISQLGNQAMVNLDVRQ